MQTTMSNVVVNPVGSVKVKTKLKFSQSTKNDSVVAFVSKDPITKQFFGVKEEATCPKQVCVVGSDLKSKIVTGILYDVVMVPMIKKCGYVAVEVKPAQFKATISVQYIPKCKYSVSVRFGNKTVYFNPLNQSKETVYSLQKCRELLANRTDVKDKERVLHDFTQAAHLIIGKMHADGIAYVDPYKKKA